MFALCNIVMKGNSKSWSLSHPNENRLKDFTLDSCMVKEKGLSHKDYIPLFGLLFGKLKVRLTEIISKLQFEKSRHYSNMMTLLIL